MTSIHPILIVEDEDVIRTSLCKLLAREGYEVRDARNIDDAVKKYQLNDFALIISDLRLPGSPGTELIEMGGRRTGIDHDQLRQPALGSGYHAYGRRGLHSQTL